MHFEPFGTIAAFIILQSRFYAVIPLYWCHMIFIIIISIVAGVVLGVISNWLYDILRKRRFLPDNPNLKTVIIVVMVFLPFVFLAGLPSFLSEPTNTGSFDSLPTRQSQNSIHVEGGIESSTIIQGSSNVEINQYDSVHETLPPTEVIKVFPVLPEGGLSEPVIEGSCWMNSNVLRYRPDAWRCISSSILLDPCFEIISPFGGSSDRQVVCGISPENPTTGYILKLTEPLPFSEDRTIEGLSTEAWQIELFDGQVCSFMGGATGAAFGSRVNYGCGPSGGYILGELVPGRVWVAQLISISGSFSIEKYEIVPIRRIWQ